MSTPPRGNIQESLLPNDGVRLSAQAAVQTSPDGASDPLAVGLRDARLVETQGEWIKIEYTLSASDLLRLKSNGVTEAESASPGEVNTAWVKGHCQTQRCELRGGAIWVVEYGNHIPHRVEIWSGRRCSSLYNKSQVSNPVNTWMYLCRPCEGRQAPRMARDLGR